MTDKKRCNMSWGTLKKAKLIYEGIEETSRSLNAGDVIERIKQLTSSHAIELVTGIPPDMARINLKRLKGTLDAFERMFHSLKCDVVEFETALEERGIL